MYKFFSEDDVLQFFLEKEVLLNPCFELFVVIKHVIITKDYLTTNNARLTSYDAVVIQYIAVQMIICWFDSSSVLFFGSAEADEVCGLARWENARLLHRAVSLRNASVKAVQSPREINQRGQPQITGFNRFPRKENAGWAGEAAYGFLSPTRLVAYFIFLLDSLLTM